jgi:lactose/L-arabinose transport system ATP-binding protein
MSELKLRGLRKSFGAIEVIKGVDLDIASQEFVVFVGPSGCGKSTILRMIAGLESISDGELEIGGQRMNDVDPSKRGIAMVFQSYALYPHMSVRQNMGFALKFAGVPRAEIERQVLEAARILELEPLLDRRPKELSGGQRQRAAIGRAIVRHPNVFLFDEPLSNLDAELRVHMRIEIARLHKELKATIVYVTHDQVEAMTLADRIVVLRDGAVAQVGTPLELYDDPDNLFVAGFIGSPKMNFLRGVVAGGGKAVRLADYPDQTVALPALSAPPKDGSAVTVGLRPGYFNDSGSAKLDLEIEMVEHLGLETYVYGRHGKGDVITVATHAWRDLKAGAKLDARFDPASLLLFDSNGQRVR